MQPEQTEKAAARKSAMLYLPISMGAGLLFFLAAAWTGGYPLVARIGGAAWVATLSLIVSMPIVISRIKRRGQAR